MGYLAKYHLHLTSLPVSYAQFVSIVLEQQSDLHGQHMSDLRPSVLM